MIFRYFTKVAKYGIVYVIDFGEKRKEGTHYMAGYLSSRKLTNVKGRLKYISDEDRQENIIDF